MFTLNLDDLVAKCRPICDFKVLRVGIVCNWRCRNKCLWKAAAVQVVCVLLTCSAIKNKMSIPLLDASSLEVLQIRIDNRSAA